MYFFTILTISSVIYAQSEITIENLIENIGDETYSAPDIDLIEYYREYPMNLRDVSADELSSLPGISYLQAAETIRLIRANPEIKNHRIADIIGLSPEAEILLDVCTINTEPDKSKHKSGFLSRSRFRNRLNDVKGFEDGRYLGGKEDIYNRIIAYYSDVEVCGILNKHSGEANLDEFSSGYISYKDVQNRIIVGDFYADFGLGSLLWRQFAARKGSEVIAPVNNFGKGISPYRSTLDFAHFRGISAQTTQSITKDALLRISGFYSNHDKSATYDSLSNTVTSIYTTSNYRTESEASKKNALNEEAVSTNFELTTSGGLTIGATALSLNYSHFISSKSSSAFFGKNGSLFSGYSAYRFDNNMLSAEYTKDANSNNFLTAGFVHSTKEFELALSGRYIDRDFRSPYGYHFGEFSFPANERGIYTAISLKPSRKFKVNFFGDIFSSVGSTFTVPAIVRGMDLFAEVSYLPDKSNNYTLRIRRDSKTDVVSTANERNISMGVKNSIRLEYTSEPVKNLTSRLRVEYSNQSNDFNNIVSNGIMTFIDLRWKILDNFKFGGRYSLFSTDNFNSAIYQYEYTMPGTMRTTALFGQGSRLIMVAEYMPLNFIRLFANYVSTFKNNVNNLGSGNEMIMSNTDNRFIIQLEFVFK